MRIEIDTSSATKEELAHLAEMLRSLSGGAVLSSSGSSGPSSGAVPGYVNIFGDDAPSEPYGADQPTQSAASSSPERSGGLFSMFSDPSSSAQRSMLSQHSNGSGEEESEDFVVPKKSSGKDILDDDRIQLY